MPAKRSSLVFFITLFSSVSWGAFSNYNSILIGDQAAGMGGAATGMASDASAGAWYNPGTLAALEGQSFSASVGIYKKFDTRFGEKMDIVTSALKANEGFFQAIPSSTGSIIRPHHIPFLEGYTLTLSILVPEFDSYRGDINSTDDNLSSLTLVDQSLWVGGAISRPLSAKDFVGMTVYYTARSLTQNVNERYYVSPTDFEIYSEERTIKQNALVFVFGYFRKLTEEWNFGVSLRPSSIHIAGQATYNENRIVNGVIDPPLANNDLTTRSRIPAKLSVGFSYSGWTDWLWSWDISVYGQEQYNDLEMDEVSQRIEHQPIVNGAVGAQYRWLDWLSIRAGFFTNFSAHPKPDPAKVRGQGDRVDQLGFAANVAVKSGNIEYTFGGYYSGGNGQSVQRINRQLAVVDKVQNTFTMLVGTSYFF